VYSVRPTLYISLIAERQSMKVGIPEWRESRMFCQQVEIELSAVRTCSVALCIIFAIKNSVLFGVVLLLLRERRVREWVCAEFSKIGNSFTPGRNNTYIFYADYENDSGSWRKFDFYGENYKKLIKIMVL